MERRWKERRSFPRSALAICWLVGSAALTTASAAQEVRFGGSDVSQRKVTRLPVEQNSNFSAVSFLFDHLLDSHEEGEFIYHQHLVMIGVEPGSEAARIVTESILAWRALDEARPTNKGLQGEAFERAGREYLRRSVRELRQVYRTMLRELTKAGYSTEPIEFEVEKRRRGIVSTVYGEPDPQTQRILDSFDEPDPEVLP
ncbi:MAG TPA: hypothetical protein VHM02_04695 [Thermoanaerobaculia bacterium]|nr:hypothetical protein [Thermoanaerobaculia bacterium]